MMVDLLQLGVREQLPLASHEILKHLHEGLPAVYNDFRSQALKACARKRDLETRRNRRLFPNSDSLEYRILDIKEFLLNLHNVSLHYIRRHEDRNNKKPMNLLDGQAPPHAAVLCSDSRLDFNRSTGGRSGASFVFKTVGATVNGGDDHQQINDLASQFLTYAYHLGVQDISIISHGNCGCMQNICNHLIDPNAHGDHHHETYEAAILRDMAEKRRFLLDGAKEKLSKNPNYYNELLGYTVPDDAALPRALEIESALHTEELSRNHIDKLNQSRVASGRPAKNISIHRIHIELRREFAVYIFNPDTNRYVQITHFLPFDKKSKIRRAASALFKGQIADDILEADMHLHGKSGRRIAAANENRPIRNTFGLRLAAAWSELKR